MRLAIAQIRSKAGDFAATCDRVAAFAGLACERGAAADVANDVAAQGGGTGDGASGASGRGSDAPGVDLLVVSPMAMTGPEPPSGASSLGFSRDLLDAVGELASTLGQMGVTCLLPIVTSLYGEPMMEALLLRDGSVEPLWLSEMAREFLTSRGGDAAGLGEGPAREPLTFVAGGLRVGVALSDDELAELGERDWGVDLVLCLDNAPFALDDPSSALGGALAESRYQEDAAACSAWLACVGSLGCYDTQVFCGGSFVLTPAGEPAAMAPSFEEGLIVCDVGPGASWAPVTPEVFDKGFFAWRALSLGVADYLAALGTSEAAVALDGSLSSLALATLACDALGPEHVHALVWARPGTAEEGLCRQLAHNLRVDVRTLDGDDTGKTAGAGTTGAAARVAAGSIPAGDAADAHDVAMMALALLARATGAAPLSSADKTGLALEMGVGASAARVACGMLAPFGDLYRTDILELMRSRNMVSAIIPEVALASEDVPALGVAAIADERPERALLRIDSVLAQHVEWGKAPQAIVRDGEDAGLVTAVVAAVAQGEPIRRLAPPSIIASTRSLAELRWPVGVAWHDRARDDDSSLEEEDFDAGMAGVLERVAEAMFGGSAGDLAEGLLGEDDLSEDVETPDADDESGQMREVRDLLGNLADFSYGGNMSQQGPGGVGGHGPGGRGRSRGDGGEQGGGRLVGGWGMGPFSEN